MTTPKTSLQGIYPFAPPVGLYEEPYLRGILDAFFVIQGEPTGPYTGPLYESSSATEEYVTPFVQLRRVAPGMTEVQYTFWAVEAGWYWEIVFAVPVTGGMGQVRNSDATSCTAVLIFDTELLYSGAPITVALRVESGRTEWHIERLNELKLYNIWRQNGEERRGVLLPFLTIAGAIELVDGYNTEWLYSSESTELAVTASAGLGKGRCPDYGDTVGGGGSSAAEFDLVTTINGIAPRGGDILVEVSPSLGLQRSAGKLTIVVKS
jgi:hypothetical protein